MHDDLLSIYEVVCYVICYAVKIAKLEFVSVNGVEHMKTMLLHVDCAYFVLND